MSENKLFFSQTKIRQHLYTLNSIDDKINYLKSQLKIYEEIYSHNNDEDIEAYIKRHKVGSLVYKGYILHKRDETIIDYFNFRFSVLNHISTHFKNFQYQILLLIKYVEKELSDLVFLESVFEDNFRICFDKDELFKIMRMFDDDDYSALGWIEKEYKKIRAIIDHYSFELFEKLHLKYNLVDNIHVVDNKIRTYRNTHGIYLSFKDRLQNVLIPAIEYFIDELDFKITLHSAFYKYPDQFEDVADKFPLFKYDFHYVNSYCESIFKLIEEQIEYFSYIVLSYNLSHKQDSANAEKNKSVIFPFEQKLAHLKTVYELNRNKAIPSPPAVNLDTSGLVDGIKQAFEPLTKSNILKPSKSVVPLRKQYSELINHYFDIALKVYRVPKQEELADNKFSGPSWSKIFDEPVFLLELSQRINRKLNSKRIKAETKEVYIKLKSDLIPKLEDARKKEKAKSGQTNKNNKSFNENNPKHNKKNIFDEEDEYDLDNGAYNDNYNDSDIN